ncbi:MAG: hypothetical protein JSW28_05180 [Thermoplasmata archaeon]|nr:MAG: hypothetical protein JSW28_05180 [Thermoplasmata archaeon]
MKRKDAVIRFRLVVIALNCLLASISLINLYTVSVGAVKVDIPEETDFAWTIDTKHEEATFLANFTVENRGLYDIQNLDIHAVVISEKGNRLVDYVQEDLTIPSRQKKTFNIVAQMPFENIDTKEWRGLMVNDSVFYLDVDIRANYLWGLGTFVVDDVLEYPWEAPLTQTNNGTDEEIVDLVRYVVSGDADLDDFVRTLLDDAGGSALITGFDFNDASLRIESWPIGENTSRIITRLGLDVFNGKHSLTFEFSFILKMEVDEYEIAFEGFSFDYR